MDDERFRDDDPTRRLPPVDGRASAPTHREEGPSIVRHEEEVSFGVERRPSGSVRLHKHVDVDVVTETVPVDVEYVEMERVIAEPDDDGQTRVLPDGSVSMAVLEERVVVRTETVVAERITLRKFVNRETRSVDAEVRSERVEIDDSETPGRVVNARDSRQDQLS